MLKKTEYWILDGFSTTFELREEIKKSGGKWNPDHKAWSIVTDDLEKHKLLRSAGLKFQYRREAT